MNKVTATIGYGHYLTEVKSESGHDLIADEPEELGGQNKGPTPDELLAASLATCTCITLRMYADRKKWPLESITTEITVSRDTDTNSTNIEEVVTLKGELDDDQRKRLMQIAQKCPIHKTLTNPIYINCKLQ